MAICNFSSYERSKNLLRANICWAFSVPAHMKRRVHLANWSRVLIGALNEQRSSVSDFLSVIIHHLLLLLLLLQFKRPTAKLATLRAVIISCVIPPYILWGYECYYCCMQLFPVFLHIYTAHPLMKMFI